MDDGNDDYDYNREDEDRHWEEDDSDYLDSEETEIRESAPMIPEEVDVSKEISIVENSFINSSDKELVAKTLETLASTITCVVCLTNKIQILCDPCGHLVICAKCLQGLEKTESQLKCPLCRTKIIKTILALLP